MVSSISAVIQLPAQCGDVFGRALENDQPAMVCVHPKCDGVVRSHVCVQAQAVDAEAPPGVEALRFDEHIPETHVSEDVGLHPRSPPCNGSASYCQTDINVKMT